MNHEILISSSSSTEASKPPPLLWLPNELLDEILRLAYEDEPAHRPICRRLYPIQQKYLYRRVCLESYEALGSFCLTVRTVVAVREYVDELELRMDGERNCVATFRLQRTPSVAGENSDEEGGVDDDDVVDEVVTPPQLSLLLARLPSLRILDLQEVDHGLVEAVLLREPLSQNLAKLEVLRISAWELYVVNEHGDEGEWLQQLARLPRLKEFRLAQRGEDGVFLPSVEKPVPLLHLTDLALSGNGFEKWGGPDLQAIAPHLLHLTLDELYDTPEFATILRTAPVTLRSLTLRCAPELSYTVRHPSLLDDILPRFTHLEHLALCEDTFTPGRLLPYLRSLSSLHTLSFNRGTLATDKLLLDIVDGPLRLPHLRRLTLDHVQCARWAPRHREGSESPPGTAYPSRLWPGYHDTAWGPGCSDQGVQAAVEAARGYGIEVDGTALRKIASDS